MSISNEIMKNIKVVLCLMEKINKDYVVVRYKNMPHKVYSNQISDYQVDLSEYFSVGKVYKFGLIGNKYLSYKAIRPKLLKNKSHTMPTMSGYKNLEVYLLEQIGYTKEQIEAKRKNKRKSN